MPLNANAQMLVEVIEEPSVMSGEPVVMYSDRPAPEVVMEMHDMEGDNKPAELSEVLEPVDIEIVVDDLPGVEALDTEREHSLEVADNDTVESNQSLKAEDSDSKKSRKDPKWDWEGAIKKDGPHGFVAWIKACLDDVPKHSGFDSAGIERAISYLDKLDGEISKAMRVDLEGLLDANKIEEVRSKIDDGVERLYERLDKVRSKKGKRKKRSEAEPELVKEAQKAQAIAGIVITVPLLISRIARVCINGMVSGGHDIEIVAKDQIEKYKLSDREQAELYQLLADMGYPMYQDRGYMVGKDDVDRTDGKYDWSSQFYA